MFAFRNLTIKAKHLFHVSDVSLLNTKGMDFTW